MSKSQGFVMVPRDVLRLSIWDNPVDVAILLYCVLHASYQDTDDLKAGQFYTSRLDIAEDLHMCRNTFGKHFSELVQRGYFCVEHTKRGSIVTVMAWEHFAKGIDFFCAARRQRTKNVQSNGSVDAQEMTCNAQNLGSACTNNAPYQYREENKKPLCVSPEQEKRAKAFEDWWEAYPKHGSRKLSFQAYMNHEATPDQLMQSLEKAKESILWLRENGRFIPKSENWLAGPWMDTLPHEPEQRQKERRECKTY